VIRQDFYEEIYAVYRADQVRESTDELMKYQSALLSALPYLPSKITSGDAIVYRAVKDELASRFARQSIDDVAGYNS
jgi:hypothetical protein